MQGHSIPPEVYTVSNGQLKHFTHLNDGAVPPTHTISVKWENDRFHVQGWLSFPANYDPRKIYPLLVEAHGGPEWSIGSRWNDSAWGGISSFWPGMGYFVFHPNPRGREQRYATALSGVVRKVYASAIVEPPVWTVLGSPRR